MPTNILRNRNRDVSSAGAADKAGPASSSRREIFIHAGRVVIRARLHATVTADRLWAALPLYSTAETFGRSVHFEVPVASGLEPGARALVSIGEIAFLAAEQRIAIAFGATPISRPGEMRLASPGNLFATALDDVTRLAAVVAGQRVAVLEAAS